MTPLQELEAAASSAKSAMYTNEITNSNLATNATNYSTDVLVSGQIYINLSDPDFIKKINYNNTRMISNIATNKTSIGTLSSLTTSVKTSLVAAINEVRTTSETNKTSIGTLSSLTTTQTSLVAAINALEARIKALEDA